MESILPIALKLCARSPSILSDVSMQFVPMQNWTGLEWKALTLMDELCFTSQRHLPSHVCKIVQANGPMSGICTCLTCLQRASNDRKRLLEIISEMRRQSFGRWEQLLSVQSFGRSLLLCFCLCVQTAMAFGVLAILGPERSQSPEVAQLFGSKVSDGFNRTVADIWAVSTCSWNQKMEMLGSLELFGCHREAWAKTSRLLSFCSKQHQYPRGVQLAGFLCFLSVLQYCCFLCMN